MLEEHGKTQQFEAGELIFRQGQSGDSMYLIVSGKVEIYRNKEGKETKLGRLKPGEFFGEMALFDSKPRSASARTVGQTELQVIDRDAFKALMKDPIVWEMLEKMSGRIRQVDEKIEELSVQDQVRKEHLSTLTVKNSWFV